MRGRILFEKIIEHFLTVAPAFKKKEKGACLEAEKSTKEFSMLNSYE